MSIPVKREVKVLSLQDILQKNGLIKKVHKNIFDDDDDVEYLPNLTLPALNDLNLPQEILSRLFIHQKEGVSWLYSCYLNSSGALLADDMGLGTLNKYIYQRICTLLCIGKTLDFFITHIVNTNLYE